MELLPTKQPVYMTATDTCVHWKVCAPTHKYTTFVTTLTFVCTLHVRIEFIKCTISNPAG